MSPPARARYGLAAGLQRWGVWLAGSSLVWSLFGLVRVVQFQVYSWMGPGTLVSAADLFAELGLSLLVWALASPCIVAAALRWPLRRPGLLRGVALHGGLFIALLVLEAWATTWWSRPTPLDRAAFITTVYSILPADFLAYLAIVAIARVLVQKRTLVEAEAESLLHRAARERSESMALRMQLHPHFIMNALHAVAELIEEDPAAAVAMVDKLEEMVAQTQDIGRQEEVPLTRELGLVEAYLAIQRYRLGARLQVEMRVGEGLGDVLVPGFVLQPLVENGVVHGVARSPEGGTVQIRVTEHAEALQLEVLNTCPEGADWTGAARKEGTGLRNTRLRLAQLYGSAHTLHLGSVGGGWMRASMSVPLRRAPAATDTPAGLRGLASRLGEEGDLDATSHEAAGQRLTGQT